MPQFYFHLASEAGYSLDEEGLSFETVEDAYLDAYRAILDISFEMLRLRKDPNNHRFEITDAAGIVVIDVPFSEVLRPRSTTPTKAFYDGVRSRMRRSCQLKADLALEIGAARETIANTKRVLSRSRAGVV